MPPYKCNFLFLQNEKIPDSANFLRHTFRELGRIRGQRKQFEDCVDVENVPTDLSPDEEETREKFWSNTDAQKLLGSFARLRKSNALVEKDDILEDLEEAAHYKMTKTKLQDLLRKFVDKSLIVKTKGSKKEETQYKLPQVARLRRFMNPMKVEMPDIPEEDEESTTGADARLSSASESLDSSPSPQLHHMVSNNLSEQSSAGSKNTPLTIDLCDDDSDSSLSSITMDPSIAETNKKHSNANVVTPAKSQAKISVKSSAKSAKTSSGVDKGLSFVGERVAKCFDGYPGEVFFGSVNEYCADTKLWKVIYDDGDVEEYNRDELRRWQRLYRRRQKKDDSKPSGTSEASLGLTNIEDIPMVRENDTSKNRTFIVQPKKRRRIYFTGKGDTPAKVAKRAKVDVRQIIRDNKRRDGYNTLCKSSVFTVNSPIVLPLEEK